MSKMNTNSLFKQVKKLKTTINVNNKNNEKKIAKALHKNPGDFFGNKTFDANFDVVS